MNRLATTVVLGGWLGFCLTGAGSLAIEATGEAASASAVLDGLGGGIVALPLFPALGTLEASVFAMVMALFAIGIGLALLSLHAPAQRRHAEGERLAAAVLAGLAAFYAAAAMAGSGVATLFGEGPSFLFTLALGFAALLFDHLVAVEDDREDDAAFEAALASIVEMMPERRVGDGAAGQGSRKGPKP